MDRAPWVNERLMSGWKGLNRVEHVLLMRSFWSAINIAQPKIFFSAGIQILVERYNKRIVLQVDYVEKWYVKLLTVTSIKAVKFILLLFFDSPSYLLITKCVWFMYETFHFLRRPEPVMLIKVHRSAGTVTFLLSGFNQIWVFSTVSKNNQT